MQQPSTWSACTAPVTSRDRRANKRNQSPRVPASIASLNYLSFLSSHALPTADSPRAYCFLAANDYCITAVYRKRNTILLYVVINSPVVQQRIPPRPLPDLSCRSPECVHLFPLVVTICTPIPSMPPCCRVCANTTHQSVCMLCAMFRWRGIESPTSKGGSQEQGWRTGA